MGARDYLTLLREQAWLIATFVVLGLVGALALTAATPTSYASVSAFYIVSNGVSDSTSGDTYQGAQLSTDRVKSYKELLESPRVAQEASDRLGGRIDAEEIQSSIATDSVAETVIISMTVTSTSPDRATTIAYAVAGSFTDLIASIETPNTPQRQGVPIVNAELVQQPSDPVEPAGPRPVLNVLAGVFIGLLLGLGVATARRSLGRSMRSPEELEDVVGAPVLTVVPEDSSTKHAPVAVVDSPQRRAAARRSEAYQRLRNHLEFANLDGTQRVLVITSALHDEGKTTTTANLAAALAGTGNRVVVVEADLRRPSLLRCLGLAGVVGLSGVITGSTPLDEVLQDWDGRFDVLGAGDARPRPSELLASPRVGELVEDLRRRYDFVLLDSPPVLPVADAAMLGRHADGVIVVCRSGRTSRDAVHAAITFLRSVSVPVVGAVLSHATNLPALKRDRRGVGSTIAGPVSVAVGGVRKRMSAGPVTGRVPVVSEPTPAAGAVDADVPEKRVTPERQPRVKFRSDVKRPAAAPQRRGPAGDVARTRTFVALSSRARPYRDEEPSPDASTSD